VSCYRLIDAEKAHHSVSQLARVLGVARAGYFAWASRPPSERASSDALLGEQIRAIHARSPTRAGLRTAIFDFIEVFYNRQRRHSTLDYQPPATDEQHASAAPAA
jgi:transposase InsO family protein